MADRGTELNIIRTEGDVRVPEYRKGLEAAEEEYSIAASSYKNNREVVMDGAVRLLSGYDIDPFFSTSPERNLFALAISDAWLSTDSIREKKSTS